MFETVKSGPQAGELVRLEIPEPSRRVDAHYPRGTVSGYGKNLPTPWRVRTVDQRWRRVYAVCYSNVCTLYVWHKGVRTIVAW